MIRQLDCDVNMGEEDELRRLESGARTVTALPPPEVAGPSSAGVGTLAVATLPQTVGHPIATGPLEPLEQPGGTAYNPRLPIDLEERFIESEVLFNPGQFREERSAPAPPAEHLEDDGPLDVSDLLPQSASAVATSLTLGPRRQPSARGAAGLTAARAVADNNDSDHPLASFRPAIARVPQPHRRYELIYRNYAPPGPSLEGEPVPLPASLSDGRAAPSVLLRVAFFDKKSKRQEWIVHGGQTLLELRKVLDCVTTKELEYQHQRCQELGENMPPPSTSALFYIEGGFFFDDAEGAGIDLSEGPRAWLEARGEPAPEPMRMDEVTFEMLWLRLGKQYLFLHQGSCEHTLVFTACWLATAADEQDGRAYPKLGFQRKMAPKMCTACHTAPAKWQSHGDTAADAWPSYLCGQCNFQFHYTAPTTEHPTGRLTREDFQMWPCFS